MPTNSGSRWGIDYPVVADPVSQLRLSIVALTQAVEARAALIDRGAVGSRPTSTGGTPGIVGRFYIGSDVSNRLDYDYGTGWLSLASYDDPRFTKRGVHTFTTDEDQSLPAATKVIGRFPAPAGTIIKVRHNCMSGTGEVKLQKNGVDISGLDDLDLSTTATTETPSGTETTAELDEIRLVCKTQGTVKGPMVGVFIDV